MINTLLPNNAKNNELSFEIASKITKNYINICKEYGNKYNAIIITANRLWIVPSKSNDWTFTNG